MIEAEKTETIVYDYVPPNFPVHVAEQANDFVFGQETKGSDFTISDLSAEQAGINELNRNAFDLKVNDLALEKLKEIQERAYKEAYDLGVIEGTEKAFEDMKMDFKARLEKIDEVIKSFDEIKKRIFEHNEAHFVKLLYLLSNKIAFKEIKEDKGQIVELVTHLIHDLQGAERVVAKISQEDYSFIEKLRERGVKEAEALVNVKLDVGEEIESGGCILETNYGVIDATLDKRVDKVWNLLEARLPKLKESERNLPKNLNENDDSKLAQAPAAEEEIEGEKAKEEEVSKEEDTSSEDQ